VSIRFADAAREESICLPNRRVRQPADSPPRPVTDSDPLLRKIGR
jgi:hypothetical protein